LLASFLRSDLAEEVRGDLEEKFYLDLKSKSVFKSKLIYWYQVLSYLRPFAIRKSTSHYLNNYAMFQNYFKIGWRNLLRNKGYSLINIGGLALGMSVALLIGLWMYDELTYNQSHTNYDRIVRVMQHQTIDGKTSSQVSIPMPLEPAIRNEYGNDFTYISMSSWVWDHVLSFDDQRISRQGAYVQADFPDMLALKMVAGTRTALKDATSVLISSSTAKALFGTADPLNKAMRIDNKLDVKVGGVYEDIAYNSTFNDLEFIASWDLYLTSEDWLKRAVEQWGNNSFQLYAQLAPEADLDDVSEKIKEVKARNDKMGGTQFKPEVYLFPMSNWHLRSDWKNGVNSGGRIQMVWLFGIIGVFVLLLACINFMNLSTARSEKRAKEVGIRMTIGSVRSQLINQFLSESFLVVLMAFVLAIGIVALSLPAFNGLADKKISINWANPFFWMISLAFIILTSLLAGSYPALYLSSFQPVKVLKGTFKMGRFASLPRKVLVVIQFTVSITLVIGTIIVYEQIQFSKSRPIGYDREGLVMIQMKTPDFYNKYDVLSTELKNTGAVDEMAEASSPMMYVGSNSGGFSWEGKDPNLQQTDFGNIWITPEYGKTVSFKIKDGRDFSREHATDSSAIIINESAVKFIGVKDAVGMEITYGKERYHVIGVIQDMMVESPYNPIRPTIYFLNYENVEWILLKLNPEKNTSESLAAIEAVFKRNIPAVPFDYKFADESYEKKFAAEERVGKLAYVFASLAILISCLGLFGLASFVAEQRTKEIGIRKVMGASVANL
jgi:ABC-type antimicrobial peptide transport system permease subunit